jgi:hypothetical protein
MLEPREVLHIRRLRKLAAGLHAIHNHRVQIRPRGINRRRQAGRPAAYNHHILHVVLYLAAAAGFPLRFPLPPYV